MSLSSVQGSPQCYADDKLYATQADWSVYLSYAEIGGYPWRHLDVRASRRPHTSRINIATTPLSDPITPIYIHFCMAISNLLKPTGYLTAL
jgi:hypothetical protein